MAYRCYAKKYGIPSCTVMGVIWPLPLTNFSVNPDIWNLKKKLSRQLNNKIHQTIEKFVKEDGLRPHKIEEIDINKLNISIYLTLMYGEHWTYWHNHVQLAQTLTAKYGNFSACVHVLLFTTNNQCSFPLHTLLTDAIETCGGSGRLVKMFPMCMHPLFLSLSVSLSL